MDRDAHPLDPDVPRVESSHRRRRRDNAQAFQFAHDPLIAPARVFARDPPNQFSCLGTDRATASSATMRPRPGDQPTMPVEQCGRLDDEFLACLGRAFGTEVTLGAVLRKARFWEKYARVQVNDRQRDVINAYWTVSPGSSRQRSGRSSRSARTTPRSVISKASSSRVSCGKTRVVAQMQPSGC